MPESVSDLLKRRAELDERRAELDEKIRSAAARERGKLVQQVVDLIRKHDLSISEIEAALQSTASPGKPGRGKRVPAVQAHVQIDASTGKGPQAEAQGTAERADAGNKRGSSRLVRRPMYLDPETGESWTGIGLRPLWVRRKLEAGCRLEDLLAR